MNKIRICHIYPDLLNLYGDRGNIATLAQRIEARGIKAEVTELTLGKKLDPEAYDIFFIGGGQDFEQSVLLKDLKDLGNLWWLPNVGQLLRNVGR